MERGDWSTAGGSLVPTVDLTGEAGGTDSWDLSFAKLRDAGLDEFSDAALRSESYEPSIRQEAIDTSAPLLEPFIFQNALRHDSLSRTVALSDLPWETPAWKFIFQADRNVLESIDPVRAFSDPPTDASFA